MFKIDNLLFAQPTAPVLSTSNISDIYPTLDVGTGLYYIGDGTGTPIRYSPYEQVLVTGGAAPDKRVYASSDVAITASDNHTYYLADTGTNDVTFTLPKQSTVDDGFRFGVSANGTGNCTINLFSGDNIDGYTIPFIVSDGSIYEFIKSPTSDRWDVIMKEVKPETGKQSHLVGFWIVDGRLKVDILATSELINVDLTKYNMTWTDGTPSWRFLDSSVEIQQLLDTAEIVLHD